MEKTRLQVNKTSLQQGSWEPLWVLVGGKNSWEERLPEGILLLPGRSCRLAGGPEALRVPWWAQASLGSHPPWKQGCRAERKVVAAGPGELVPLPHREKEELRMPGPGQAGIITSEGVVTSWKGCGQGPTTLLEKVTQTCLTPYSEELQWNYPGSPVPAASIHGLRWPGDLQDPFQTPLRVPLIPHATVLTFLPPWSTPTPVPPRFPPLSASCCSCPSMV